MVATLQVAPEVDAGREHFNDLLDDRVRQLDAVFVRIGGGEQGRVDGAGMHLDTAFQLGRFFFGNKGVALAADLDILDRNIFAIDNDRAQPLQIAFVVGLRLDAFARLQLHDAFGDLVFFDEVFGGVVFHTQTRQQRCQRVAGADAFFVDEVLVGGLLLKC